MSRQEIWADQTRQYEYNLGIVWGRRQESNVLKWPVMEIPYTETRYREWNPLSSVLNIICLNRPFTERPKWKVKVKVAQSHLTLRSHGLHSPWNSPGPNTGVGSLSLLQGILPTQGSHPGLPHCRQILYQLSQKGSPRILEWVTYPLSRGIIQTQESNRGLLHCRQILYQQSYQRSPLSTYYASSTGLW